MFLTAADQGGILAADEEKNVHSYLYPGFDESGMSGSSNNSNKPALHQSGQISLPRTCGTALKAAWNIRRQTLNGVTYGKESIYSD